MDISLGLILYNILLTMAFLLGWPYLLFTGFILGSRKWRQRCGFVPAAVGNPLWLHASSMGEVGLVPPLVQALKEKSPDISFAISTMTGTGQARAAMANPGADIFFLPLDFLFSVRLALGRIKPSALVLMETELWPNLIWLCHAKKIPVFIANARLSQRSLPYYRSFGFLFRPLLNRVECIACQGLQDVERYRSLGVAPEKIINAGNIKFDAIRRPASPEQKLDLRKRFGFDPKDLILIAGSTRAGEEEMILDAWSVLADRIKLVIAPRHPERFCEAERILTARKIAFSQRSKFKPGETTENVLLLDSMGELIDAYAAGDMAFVGGSLVAIGGHNPLEPAGLGLPVLFGPHMFNARESAQNLLDAKGAVQVTDISDLRSILERFLADSRLIGLYGRNAREVVDEKRGAAERISNIILSYINKA